MKRLSVRHGVAVHPDSFREARRRLRWTFDQVAEFLWVSSRTVRNWEAGLSRIPYPAMRLLRLRAGCVVFAAGWEGWHFGADGTLWSPNGRSFKSQELEYLSFIFAEAYAWRRHRLAEQLSEGVCE